MIFFETMKRKNFYEEVKFADKGSKINLENLIFHYLNDKDFEKFREFTNYLKIKNETFDVSYPITISGTNLSKIKIVDLKNREYYIKLLQDKIYYCKINKNSISYYIAEYK